MCGVCEVCRLRSDIAHIEFKNGNCSSLGQVNLARSEMLPQSLACIRETLLN
jgi:hypothetical protein